MGKYVYNSSLPFIRNNFNGNRVYKNKFTNHPYLDPEPTLKKVVDWKLSRNPQKAEKKKDKFKLEVELLLNLPETDSDFLIWMGHATFFIRFNKVNIITDPIFGSLPLIKRKIPFPIPSDHIKDIDYVLISHAHRDHFDKKSIKKLMDINPKAEVLGPLRIKEILSDVNEFALYQEAGWFQRFDARNRLNIDFLPAVHWHRRGLFDFNKLLWGSFLLSNENKKIFFAGDTAYDRHFDDILETTGSGAICLLPIGTYKPSFLMKESHLSPEEAVKAFKHMEGSTLIPMHFGTFDLSDEPLGEPYRKIKELEESENLNGKVKVLKPGEIYYF